MPTDWITTKEASELTRYHPEHLRRLIRARLVKGRKFGIVWQVGRSSLLAYMRAAEKSEDKRWGAKKGKTHA